MRGHSRNFGMCLFFLLLRQQGRLSAPRLEALFFGTVLMWHHEYSRSHHHHQKPECVEGYRLGYYALQLRDIRVLLRNVHFPIEGAV